MKFFYYSVCFFTFFCVAGGVEKISASGDLTLSNAVGIGTFRPTSDRMPNFVTTLYVEPHISFPMADNKVLIFEALESFEVQWLEAFNAFNDASERRLTRFSDFELRLRAPKVVREETSGFYLSPAVTAFAPVSSLSYAQNRVIGFQAKSTFGFKLGDFTVAYIPSFLSWIHSQNNISVSCSEFANQIINPHTSDFVIEDYILSQSMPRTRDLLDDGTCAISGRQTIGTLKNTLALAFDRGPHSVNIELNVYSSFLRQLEDKPELAALNSSEKSTREFTKGDINYSYKIPVNFGLSVAAGLVSYQPMFSDDGAIRFPFFDLISVNNNFSQFYIDLIVSI